MRVGISTACLYPMETEKALEQVLEQGARLVEIFLNTQSECDESGLRTLKTILSRYGAKVCSFHPYAAAFESLLFFSDYPKRFADGAALYRRLFAAAASLGARTVVFHGARRDLPISMEAYAERFGRLARIAREEGVVLAQENVSRCKCGLAANVEALCRFLGDEAHFVLDVKQARRAGEPLDAMCRAMEGRVECVHLSDAAPGKDCLLPGAGTAPLSFLKEELSRQGFSGPLLIEVYRSDFGAVGDLRRAYTFAERLFSSE